MSDRTNAILQYLDARGHDPFGHRAHRDVPAHGCPLCDEGIHDDVRARTSLKGLIGVAGAICFAAVGGAAASGVAILMAGGGVTLFLMGRLLD